MKTPAQRLETLLDVIVDGTCSDDDRREFSQLLEQHPGLTAPLIAQLRTHSLLQWHCSHNNSNVDAAQRAELGLQNGCVVTTKQPRAKRRGIRALGWVASAAVVLVVVGTLVSWRTGHGDANANAAVAEVIDDSNVVWSDQSDARSSGRAIHPGRLDIESGVLTLRFRSGASVVFRGPASMQIESDMLVRMDRGQATAQVPQWAKGFTIETPDAEIIDLGTQFGVMALGNGKTDVVIFEGEVDVKPTGGNKRVQKRLNQGEAASIHRDGAIDRIVEVRGDSKRGWSTSNHPLSSRNAFRAIRDNIPPSDGSKYFYYQITSGGLDEDAPAYVDKHPHQWNGLTGAGLPKFLRGADYARTFNDYRYIQDFHIVVELARPADVYVFFDDRVPTPSWLLERFVDTGVDIGLDEGPWEGIPDHRTAVGPGNSIDNVFSVWRRRCERPEAVTLGSVGDSKEARAMYGIAAVPLDDERKD